MATWKRNFLLVWWNNFITAIGMMAFLPLFPHHLRELGLEGAELKIWVGILVAGAPLIAALMGPFWGALGDRVGRKVMLLRANAGIVVFVGAMSFVDSIGILLLLRCGQGFFSGFIAPGMTLVSVSAPEKRQGRVSALLHTGVLAGGSVGPFLGGWVADTYGHAWVFLVCAAMSLLAMTTTALLVVEPPGTRQEGPPFGRWTHLLEAVVRDVAILLRPGPLRSVLASVFAIRFGFSLVEPLLGLFVESLEGWQEGHLNRVTGLVAGATGIATLLMTPVLGVVGDRVGHRRLLLVCAGGAGAIYFAHAAVETVGELYVLRFAAGLFLAGVMPAAYSIAARVSDRNNRGGAHGITFSAVALAMALGPLCGGMLGAVVGLRALYLVSGGMMLAALLRLVLMGRRIARQPEGERVEG